MFTGIIQSTGIIRHIEHMGRDARMKIAVGSLKMEDIDTGDSIATQGVCLTAVDLGEDYFVADVSAETLSCTTLADITAGKKVNLELSVTPLSRLGGHLVSGHVDGIGKVIARDSDGRSERFTLQAPEGLSRYIAAKGSICVDGISLTVNGVEGAVFTVNIVPHTLEVTTMGQLQAGGRVNLEVDVVARYLERLMQGEDSMTRDSGNISKDLLKKHGFA